MSNGANPYLGDENPYLEIGETPPTENLLQRAIQASRPGGVPLSGFGAFMPATGQEAADIPRAGASSISNLLLGATPRQEPQTEFGRTLELGGTTAPLALGIGAATKGIGKFLLGGASPERVTQIQQSFFPFIKKHFREFGQARRAGIKELVGKGGVKVTKKDVGPIYDKLSGREIRTQLSSKVRKEVAGVKKKLDDGTATVDDIIKSQARLRRAMTGAERKGTVATEQGRAVREVTNDLNQFINKRIPGFREAKARYGPFAETKQVIERGFAPEKAKLGALGTTRGTRTLRRIHEMQPGEVEALKRFGKETGINIVGPARRAETTRKTGKLVGDLAKIGGALYLLRKLFPGQAKEAATIIDVSR